uniref:Uncharacterized protein n=1 Tax=Cacopsylla melanoneura TaxID=428564 RepID=A0A8D8RWI2_9HEMI
MGFCRYILYVRMTVCGSVLLFVCVFVCNRYYIMCFVCVSIRFFHKCLYLCLPLGLICMFTIRVSSVSTPVHLKRRRVSLYTYRVAELKCYKAISRKPYKIEKWLHNNIS